MMKAQKGYLLLVLLVRIEPEKNLDRWYSVAVQPTLLDPWAVICAWGSRRTQYRRIRVMPVESLEAGKEIATDIIARKMRRGYSIITHG
jgi:predicted DNA-binding WGR domain protein